MPNIAKIYLSEKNCKKPFARIPEEMVMTGDHQAAVYHDESQWGGAMDSIHLYHISNISKILRPGDHVLDLACGSADLLVKLAQAYPKVKFTGVDLSDAMLERARSHVQRLALKNIDFIKNDITELVLISDHSIDVVISTEALHQMPDENFLKRIASSINRVLKEGGGVYLSDFLRLKSETAVNCFLKDRADVEQVFFEDYKNSLYAAFSDQEITSCLYDLLKVKNKKYMKTRLFDFVFVITCEREAKPMGDDKDLTFKVPYKRISKRGLFEYYILKFLVKYQAPLNKLLSEKGN